MRQRPLQSRFVGAAILTDAFGFFETDRENEAVLGEINRVLAPGGRLGMRVVNGTPILAAFGAADREERDGVIANISRRLARDPTRMIEKVIVTGPRGDGEYERHQRLYSSNELSGALERVGFTNVELFASSHRAVFEPATSKTMWAFRRRPT
jgi:hypothetical protein